ncbi:MAG TPA: hypothetical protein DCY91_18690 [Cyanobacteria bacterium UBA11370]|nr:hypothetical protein [Cyanobacteria bacterium UBA11370]HBY78575.1 hypothetical protein [Cyanobacteria bacterium UBA11148]
MGALAKQKQRTGLGELANDAQTENARRLQKQSLVLMKLAQPQTLNSRDFKAVLQEISEAAADALEVGRVTVWLYNEDCTKLDTIDLSQVFARYPCQSQREAEEKSFAPPITPSPHASTRLDTPIWLSNRMVGVVSYEQIEPDIREWTNQDENFGRAIANLIALKLELCHCEQATAALAESEASYRLLVENSSDLISRHTADGTYVYASPACQTLLGYEPDELVGHSLYKFLHPQDAVAIEKAHANLLNVPEIQPVSYRIRRQDGEYIWFESTMKPIPDPDTGSVAEIFMVSRDITKRKLGEKPLAKTNPDRFNLHHLTAGKPLGTKLLDRSSLARRLPGLPNTAPPPTRSRISTLAAVVEDRLIGVMTLLGNQPLTSESRRTFGWVANAIAVAIDQYWARAEFLSRRESLLFGLANQIRESLELHTILETAVESIRSLLKIDRCQFLWYRPHEQDPYWEVVKEARDPKLPSRIGQYAKDQMEPLVKRLLNGQIIQVDEVETCSDSALEQFLSGLGYTSLLCIPIQTRTGEIGAISCGHGTGVRPWDNSEVELLQAVVAQLAIALDQAELYAKARQTAEIAQAQAQELEGALNQLKAAQAQLVQSEKMSSLGQLVAGVAHELNNPVNFIHNNLAYASAYIYDLLTLVHLYQDHYPNPAPPVAEQAELIDINFITDDLPKLLRSMQRGTDRISSIVNSLRNFARLDEAEMKSVDLNKGIESTLLLLQHRLKPKGVQSEIQIFKEYGNLPKVDCYPGQLNQVFINIISNAIDALEQSATGTPQNPSPRITIRTKLIDRSEYPQESLCYLTEPHPNQNIDLNLLTQHHSQSVVIQIADNGAGMTESVKARLFDPFFSTKPVGQGTGLGLSICYQIVVEHHHGILNCTSAPGEGTEFWIEIPIQQMGS